ERHLDTRLSQEYVSTFNDDGTEKPLVDWKTGTTSFTTANDRIDVHNFKDLGGIAYDYDDRADSPCNDFFCAPEFNWDQTALIERLHGSAIEFAPDITKDLTFTKLPNGSWSTYIYCGAEHTYPMRGFSGIGHELFNSQGSATSHVQFVATIVSDDTAPSTL